MSDKNNPMGLGATGQYPYGKSRPDDLGELKAALTVDREKHMVFLDFGKPVTWLSMTADQSEALAGSLIAMARKARG